DELFVETRLAGTGFVLVRGPEARRIRSEHFVNEDQIPFVEPEFELGVGDDDAALARVLPGGPVNSQADIPDPFGDVRADDPGRFLEGDVDVVACLGFGGGGEHRLRHFGGFTQAAGQGNAANGTVLT